MKWKKETQKFNKLLLYKEKKWLHFKSESVDFVPMRAHV